MHVAVDHAPYGLRGFESLPAHNYCGMHLCGKLLYIANATLAQRQSNSFVKRRSSVQIREVAPDDSGL